MLGTAPRPFGGQPPATVALSSPPLARVLVQARFSQVFAVADEAFVGPFQQAIIDRFPRARAEVEFAIALSGQGDAPPAATPSRLWKFQSLDELWTVTLAAGFVALETSEYPGNEAFFSTLSDVLAATAEHVRPPLAERLGVRYVQRLDRAADLEQLAVLMRPEIVGPATITDEHVELRLALTQCQFSLSDATLSARWGIVPPGATFDPTMAPHVSVSWILDIDAFDESPQAFDAVHLTKRAFDLSRRQYHFFRWAVTPEFLLRFGADPKVVAAIPGETQ